MYIVSLFVVWNYWNIYVTDKRIIVWKEKNYFERDINCYMNCRWWHVYDRYVIKNFDGYILLVIIYRLYFFWIRTYNRRYIV